MSDAVDVFAGPGGWSEGLRALGRSDIGLELNEDACRTRRQAGHVTVRCDVARYPTRPFTGIEGVIASPPCQDFSTAGLKAGIYGDRGRLVMEALRWTTELRPRWAAFEQVPAVIQIWRFMQRQLEADGYHVWAGKLNAADYGAPQSRTRAILIAHRDRRVLPPPATHCEHGVDDLFNPRQQWVTMFEACGWDGVVGFPRRDDGRGAEQAVDGYRGRDWRSTDLPSVTVTEKARSWVLNTGRRWKKGGTREDAQTIDMLTAPAPTLTGMSGRQWQVTDDEGETRNITVNEALTLQTFRPDYPMYGTRTSRFLQVGNAIPPLLAQRVLEQVLL